MRRLLTLALCLPVLSLLLASVAAPAQATLAPTDVVFVFDTSGSMESALGEAKGEIQEVMARLQGSISSVQFGLAKVRDTGEEESGWYAWQLDQSLTSNASSVSEAISTLTAFGGGDSPEAYGRALYETDTNPSVGWRSGARHLIVLIADQVPHMPDVNEGINEEFWLSNPFFTGEELEAQAAISQTQWHPGVNIQFKEDLRRLVADEKPLETVDYHSTSTNYIHYWEYWAGLGGGSAVEASEAGKELATRLIGLVEAAGLQCATSASPSEPSPGANGLPTALTPRFRQPGSRVTVTTSTSNPFCPEDSVQLGDAKDSAFEESTVTKRVFHVSQEASSGLGLAGPSGLRAPKISYAVDNFRDPWGFAISNTAGHGGDGRYDANIRVTSSDLETVFAGLGGPKSTAYEAVEREAYEVLQGGLCYGFGLISWELYLDTHGNSLSLGWSGSTLSKGQLPINIPEAATGSHALTHALLRASISQISPEAAARAKYPHSGTELAAILDSGFTKGQPVLLSPKWKVGSKTEGHTLLAYNYRPTGGGGIDVDVVDPNVPTNASPQTAAYPQMQVHVHPDGSWNYAGSFHIATHYSDPISGGSGTLEVAVDPRVPGGLNIPANLKHGPNRLSPRNGATISAISYGATPGHGIPSDVESSAYSIDTPTQRLMVPPSHHVLTATIDGPAGGSADLIVLC